MHRLSLESHVQRRRGVAFTLAALLCTGLLGLSMVVLYDLGYMYIAETGSAYERLHPTTYLVVLAFGVLLLKDGHPGLKIDRWISEVPDVILYLVLTSTVFVYGQIVVGTYASHIIDTFIAPGIVVLLLRELAGPDRLVLRRIVDGFFAVNALIAIAEYATKSMVTTPIIEMFWGPDAGGSWRSQGLFGHPLVNGILVALYIVFNLAPKASFALTPMRMVIVVLNLVALPCFGARVATVVTLVFLAIFLVVRFAQLTRGEGVSLMALALLACVVSVLPAVVLIAVQTGYLDPLIDRFVNDQGSGDSRFIAFEMFAMTDWQSIIFGDIDRQQMRINRFFGIEIGIEISWISLILTYGVIMTGLLMLAMIVLARRLVIDCGRRVLWPVAAFFLIDVSAMGIGAKGTGVSILVLLAYVFADLRDDPVKEDWPPRIAAAPADALVLHR